MKPEREPYIRIIVGIATLAILPPLGIANFGPDDWFTNLQNWQSGVGAFWGALFGLGAILIGALFNADLNRKRDADLRDQNARGLADALCGELRAALGTCRAFVNTAKDEAADDLTESDLEKVVPAATLAPHVMTIVFEGNVDKIGLLGTALATELVVIYELLRNWSRMARETEALPLRTVIERRRKRAGVLENDIEFVEGAIEILNAYIEGGYPAAYPVGARVTKERLKRQKEFAEKHGLEHHIPTTHP